MDSPRQPPYDVSELEAWLEGVTIYRNPCEGDQGFFSTAMLHPTLDYYSAEIGWDDGCITRIMARKKTFFPIRSKYEEVALLGYGAGSYWQEFWEGFDGDKLAVLLLRPYFAWTATFDPAFAAARPVDHEAGFRAYCEREGYGYDPTTSKKIFKLMKRLHASLK